MTCIKMRSLGGSPRDQVSLVKGGGAPARSLGARSDLPGGALQVERRTTRRRGPLSPALNKSAAGAGCALPRETLVLPGPTSKCFRQGSGQTPVGTKTGFPRGALSPKPQGLLSQVCGCSVPGQAKEGRSRSPLTGQPERPRGSRSGAAAQLWPLPGLAPLRAPPPPGSPALGAELRPAGAYLGHWPAPGWRRKPAAARTPLPPPRAPSRRRPGASASPFLPGEVGARRTQRLRRLRSRALRQTRTSAGFW